ncbi:MAG: exodeoxyribonuclease VII large subunit [Chloroflexi bacterium]|nr:exodeoxyribonuclease VII large subunit [Chloroflexota bacterium]
MALFTVSQIAQYLRESLDRDDTLRDLWIGGEVSNLSRSAAGNTYFTLKDAAAQLRCVMFRRNRGSELLANGGAVNAHGRISLYEARGEVQLYVDMVQPAGLGVLHLELERLKAQLEEEGLFDPSRKRPLPPFPRRIGVVTSEQGAVFQDICHILARRYPIGELVLCPASVQGESAAPEICDAIRTLGEKGDVDLIIVARGGGSLEDLWPFNQESVARAIFASPVPVVSAVGHETDYTIADYVADVRAPTPSAAAELVAPDIRHLQAQVATLARQAHAAVAAHTASLRREAVSLVARLPSRAPNVAALRQRVDELTSAGRDRLFESLGERQQRLEEMEWRLASLNPSRVLARGYAVVQKVPSGETVFRTSQVATGDPIRIAVSDGSFGAQVADVGHGDTAAG